jgi:hypothetical protein
MFSGAPYAGYPWAGALLPIQLYGRQRRGRKRIVWDEDEELRKLLNQLGRHPTEFDKAAMRAEAKAGLAYLIRSGEPVVAERQDTALVLRTVGADLVLHGVLKRHVEILLDDRDVMDLLDLVA